jgi:AraC-like DNA-binding protein
MKIPYRFDFNGDVKYRTVLSSLPEDYTYAMPAAKSRLYYLWNGTEILSQQLNRTPFFTEMVDVKCQQTTEIPFIVDDAQIFLFFMIRGQVTFQANDGNPIIVTRNNTFMISVYGSGRFTFKAEAGKHIAFIINIQRKWMEEKSVQYSKICTVLRENLDKLYFTMNQYRMDRKVNRWLRRIFKYSKKDKGGLEGHLLKYVGYILTYYNTHVEQDELPNLAEQLRKYMDENYCNPKLNVKMLAENFYLTRQTLRNHFTRTYDTSVQNYYTTLRMKHALALRKEGLSDNEIYEQVGYTDIRSFQSTMNRYIKRKNHSDRNR